MTNDDSDRGPWHLCGKCASAIPPNEPWFEMYSIFGEHVLCLYCKLSDQNRSDDEVKELYQAEMARLAKR